MPASTHSRAVTPSQLRAAMLGRQVPGVEVVRQAWRVTDDDSHELVLFNARGKYWVARRVSDRITLWAFTDDLQAEDAFERLVHDPGAEQLEWHLASEAAS
jgi:hypothetical protein